MMNRAVPELEGGGEGGGGHNEILTRFLCQRRSVYELGRGWK